MGDAREDEEGDGVRRVDEREGGEERHRGGGKEEDREEGLEERLNGRCRGVKDAGR